MGCNRCIAGCNRRRYFSLETMAENYMRSAVIGLRVLVLAAMGLVALAQVVA